jgi:GT2 family glycosyltransferase
VTAPLVSVVVLNWNGLEDSRECLDSLLCQDYPSIEIHVVDNGSSNGEASVLSEEFGDRIRLHQSPHNLGFTGGNNLAMNLILEEGRATYLALLNNDTHAHPSWISSLVQQAECHPRTGVFASLMLFYDRADLVENTGMIVLSSGEAMPRNRLHSAKSVTRANRPIGACAGAALYRASMLQEIGVFKEKFFANFEDVDLSLRALAKGWDCLYVPQAKVGHKLSRSIRKVRDESFFLRSQQNQLEAYWVNMPWQVILLNLPFQVLGQLALLILTPLCGQYMMAKVLWKSRLEFWRNPGKFLEKRRSFGMRSPGSWWPIWWRQRNFLPAYMRSFLAVVIHRERRFFE